MMIVRTMEKSVNGILCDVEIDGIQNKLEIAVTQLDTDLRSMDFENLSGEEIVSLSNRDEFRQFQNVVWRFVDGEEVKLPSAIVAG